MSKQPNYIEDMNRYRLAGPPAWWCRKLWDFDNSLVVVPSRQDCLYRLAQRRPPKLSTSIVNDALFNESDTKMLARYGLVPVTSILATANWSNPYLFEELRRRAPWRLGGADVVNAMLDAQDEQDRIDKQAKTDEHLNYLGKDAWNLYLKKIGTRTHMYSPATPNHSVQPKSSAIRVTNKTVPNGGTSVGSIFLP